MAVVVTFINPATGVTPPTAAQAAPVSILTATVTAADADTAITITHNLGISAADLALNFPTVIVNPTLTITAYPIWTIVRTSGNVVTITKTNLAGTGGTYEVTISRPHTFIR